MHFCIPLAKLLEREAAMTKNLPCNIPSSFNLEACTSHLKRTKMPIPNKITKKLGPLFSLIFRITNPSCINNHLLTIWSYPK
ncbi:MAG: hypothetical protein [Podoviridae sp. ctbj_2]|nr:MAG: hypothetical protein [Podoviridae sp. ctbj_2]